MLVNQQFLLIHTRVNRGYWHATTCMLRYKDLIYFNLATYCLVPCKWIVFSPLYGWALRNIDSEESEESVVAVLEDATAGWCDLLLAMDHMLSRVYAHKHSSLLPLAAGKKLNYIEMNQTFINLLEIHNIYVPKWHPRGTILHKGKKKMCLRMNS